ncbi:MAG TPA: hypothetical protein VIU64_00210, partial [Polyangia bacterium]
VVASEKIRKPAFIASPLFTGGAPERSDAPLSTVRVRTAHQCRIACSTFHGSVDGPGEFSPPVVGGPPDL